MAKIIAVTNQKGGVGKTTTCINLCAALVNIRRRVMLIDLDPQGNATVGCGVMKNEFEAGTYEVLLGEHPINEAIIKTETGIDLLAANDDLAGAQIELLEMPDREVRLKSFLMACETSYDYIFVDCPPSLNILTINAMAAAKSVLIPIQCEYYALEGVSALISTIDKIKYSLNPGLIIEGLLRTMYDGRNSLAVEVSEQLITHFGEKVYRTVIPRNVRVAEAPGYGVSVIEYDKSSKGATAYLNLAGEFLMKQSQLEQQEAEDEEEEYDPDQDESFSSGLEPVNSSSDFAQNPVHSGSSQNSITDSDQLSPGEQKPSVPADTASAQISDDGQHRVDDAKSATQNTTPSELDNQNNAQDSDEQQPSTNSSQ